MSNMFTSSKLINYQLISNSKKSDRYTSTSDNISRIDDWLTVKEVGNLLNFPIDWVNCFYYSL